MSDRVVINEAEMVIKDTNAITIPDPVRMALVADLSPVADRMALYAQKAETIVVTNEEQMKAAEAVCNDIQADIKLVEKNDVLSKITDGLHKLHRRWTGLRDAFVEPMKLNRKVIRDRVIAFAEDQRMKAEAEQRRLQAEADLKARKEQEAFEKKAACAKKTETKTKYQEAAAAVVAPTIRVEAPKIVMRGVAKVWAIKSLDEKAFLAALATRPDLAGFVTIERTKLQRAKAANGAMEIPGVVFEQKVR